MKDSSILILADIISASANNKKYGEKPYNKYFAPYSIDDTKSAIALGWARNYGNTAKKLMQKIYNYDQVTIPQGSLKSDIDYVRWAIRIADDNRYYYSHNSDPFSFSCSTLVAKALYECGYFKEDVVPADGHAIGGNDNSPLHKALFAAGFKKMPFSSTKMQAGDVMTVLPYHVAFCVSGNTMVAANGNGDMTDRSPTAITTYDYRLVGQPRWIFRLPEDQIHRSHSTWNKFDKVGIKEALDKDWTIWTPNTSQKKALVNLINSQIGRKCQDELFIERVKPHVDQCYNTFTKNTKAIFMYCMVRHLQGKNTTNTIFKNCEGKYTLDNIIKVLKKKKSCLEQIDKYQRCRKLIDKYVINN